MLMSNLPAGLGWGFALEILRTPGVP